MTSSNRFDGQFFSGEGDAEYLRMLDIARRMHAPDPELQNLSMLYSPKWNGLVEGERWDAWWIQNSYGATYCSLPFLTEPFLTFLQNSHELWFERMGDGKTPRDFTLHADKKVRTWVAPDGCLCDAASDKFYVPRQGDGDIDINDWAVEFTAAGLLMQCEMLLIERERERIERELPRLRRCAEFLESRRDPANNLFLAGPAANLLGPSYAGWRKADGTYGMAYLSGLSVTYIAALDRLIELEKLSRQADRAQMYAARREAAKDGLAKLTTDEGYFIKSLDPDGTRHGVYGAAKHGYFEASVNHDAICFRVADDAQARQIYAKIASIPGLRPHDVIITNYPGLDDMYRNDGSFQFGRWVNGGHWSTCEARMIMAYLRLGAFDDAKRSMRHFLALARAFHLDEPLKDFGATPWFDKDPIMLCYDAFGVPGAMMRGLFEYRYTAESLILYPHIAPDLRRLEQRCPVRFGSKRLYLNTTGSGPIRAVTVNGAKWTDFDEGSIRLAYEAMPDEATIEIALGGASPPPRDRATRAGPRHLEERQTLDPEWLVPARRLGRFIENLRSIGAAETYEASHARLGLDAMNAAMRRRELIARGEIEPLPPSAQEPAEASYRDAARRLVSGLESLMDLYSRSQDARQRTIAQAWSAAAAAN